MSFNVGAKSNLFDELSRLARFGANISDSFGCYIFLPDHFAKITSPHLPDKTSASELLRLVGFHSLSNDVISDVALATDSGLIGWVAKHGRSIHVSPFERDSRTLGIYSADQQLKSFIGIPIALCKNQSDGTQISGVIACDSKKAFAFSKLQGKLLEELSEQAACTVKLLAKASSVATHSEWEQFLRLGEELAVTLGIGALDALRVRIANFSELEATLGPLALTQYIEQMVRLIRQAVPPHSPITQLPSSDIILLFDNMMTSFYESKIHAISEHLAGSGTKPRLEFIKSTRKKRRVEPITIEGLIAETIPVAKTNVDLGSKNSTTVGLERAANEFRRA